MTEMQVAAKSLSAACPLCASRERRQVLTVPYDVIWERLAALDALRAAGIEGVSTRFADFAAGEAGRFDVVCGFQILEHVRRVGDLMEPAMRCARPGGRIFVSVPNRRRYTRGDLEPLDCP